MVKGLAAQGGILCFAQNDRGLGLWAMVKGLAAQGGILCFAQNDRGLGLWAMVKGLAAQGGILRFAQNDRGLLRMTGGAGLRAGRNDGRVVWIMARFMLGSCYRGWQGVGVIKLREGWAPGVLGMAGFLG